MNKKYSKHNKSSLRTSLRRLAYMLRIKRHESTSSYKKIIAPEICSGRFYELIGDIVSRTDVQTVLEIGSSSGAGSTRALLESLKRHPQAKKQVHCMEISTERFIKLRTYLEGDNRFYAHKLSSVTKNDFPPFPDIENFHANSNSKLSNYQIDTVKSWYEKDIEFLQENQGLIPTSKSGKQISGINWIKETYSIAKFDFVIIDGGEFTGTAEYEMLRGSLYFALDDTNTFKCSEVRRRLMEDDCYILVDEDLYERNGWSVFKKTAL
jgi:hypothetical protein